MKKTIFLNAGHSEVEPGANVPSNRYENEAQLNMVVRDFVIPELEEQGFIVHQIPDGLNFRESYIWVNQRAFKIEDGYALDIHFNTGGREGAEAYYYGWFGKSRKKAKQLIDAYCEVTGLKNRGAISDFLSFHEEISWIRKTNCWANLIECEYLDNKDGMEIVLNNIPLIAKGIAKGICSIYNVEYIEKEEESDDKLKKIEQFANEIIKLTKGR